MKPHQPQQTAQEAHEKAVEEQVAEGAEHVAVEMAMDVVEAPAETIKPSTEIRRFSKETLMT